MARALNESLWHQLTEEITSGMREWRNQHPKATLREIETELDARLARACAYARRPGASEYRCDLATSRPPPDTQLPPVRHASRRARHASTHPAHTRRPRTDPRTQL